MNLQEKIELDFKKALKTGDAFRRSVLVMLKAAILNKTKEKGGTPAISDEGIQAIISSEIKKRKDAVVQYRAGGREELAQKEEKEMAILTEYLPPQLSDEEIMVIIESAISQTQAQGEKDFGKVMAVVSPKIKGRADGGNVAKVVKAKLLS